MTRRISWAQWIPIRVWFTDAGGDRFTAVQWLGFEFWKRPDIRPQN